MSSFLFELPTTGAISFADFCTDRSKSYTVELAEVTQARANLRAALKESKRTDGEKDNLKLVKVGFRSTPTDLPLSREISGTQHPATVLFVTQ